MKMTASRVMGPLIEDRRVPSLGRWTVYVRAELELCAPAVTDDLNSRMKSTFNELFLFLFMLPIGTGRRRG